MSNPTLGPLPSKHIFLHEVAKQPTGSKVRFLGCVDSYHVSTGTLLLEHASPPDAPEIPQVRVDINLLLGTIRSEQLQRGTWLNVIGYVNQPPRNRSGGQMSRGGIPEESAEREPVTTVQAVVAWSAGPVRVGEYERVLARQQDVARMLLQQRDSS